IADEVAKAVTLRHLGKLTEARTTAEAALARAKGLPAATADVEHELGTILHAQGDPGDEAMLADALAIATAAHLDARTAQVAALLVEVSGAHTDVATAEAQA